MSEHDINLVTAKAGSVVAEGLKLSLATPGSSSLTPSTVTAMVGISKGEALDLAPEVKTVMSKLSDCAANVGGIYTPAQSANAAAALSDLQSLQSDLGVTGNPSTNKLGVFGAFMAQAQSHINDSIELKNATSFMSNASYSGLGSGITSMSSMVDQGLTAKLGNLTGAANVMGSLGKMFNLRDMTNFGSGAGLVNQLNANKIGNLSGVNKALVEAGVDTNDLSNPVYKDSITKVLENIKDPVVIGQIKDQLEISPAGPIGNLNDLLDVKKFMPPGSIVGLSGGFGDIGQKFNDLGAKFTGPNAAKNMLQNISVPNIPKLNSAAPNLSSLMTGQQAEINSMIGSNLTSSPTGIPNMTDFMGVVGGGGVMKQLSQSSNIDSIIGGVKSQVTNTQTLLSKAGIDTAAPPPSGLSTAMNFATGLHKFGADTSGSGITQMLGNMANSSSQYGDAIQSSLAEGKNKALMQASGIKPLDFSGVPIGEGMKNLQEGKFIPGTGQMTPDQINKIFGGG